MKHSKFFRCESLGRSRQKAKTSSESWITIYAYLHWRNNKCLSSIEWQLSSVPPNKREFCTSLECENSTINRCDSTQGQLSLFWTSLAGFSTFLLRKRARAPSVSFAMAFSPSGEFFSPGDQSRFENMMKLLLFLEAELQLKEEIIDLLLVCIVQFW